MIDAPDGLYCLKCGYRLQGLSAPRCPECGTSFDPRDPTTFSDSPRPGISLPWKIAIGAMAFPIIPVGMLILTYSFAQLSLGRPPRVSTDDPKSINAVVSTLNALTALCIYLVPAAIVVNLGALVAIPIAAVPGRRVSEAAAAVAALLLVWPTWYGCATIPLGPVLEWFAD